MGEFEWKPQWIEILAGQEQALRYSRFTREMALELGLKIVQLVKEKYHDNAAVRIVEDQTTIFAYKMPGTSLENDWWMDRKLAAPVPALCVLMWRQRTACEMPSGRRELIILPPVAAVSRFFRPMAFSPGRMCWYPAWSTIMTTKPLSTP